jgi:hypothetical protein
MLLGHVIIVGVVLLGFAGVLVAVLTIALRLLRFVLRLLWPPSWFRTARLPGEPASFVESRTCPHPRCGHVNRSAARYCGRCGRSLDF